MFPHSSFVTLRITRKDGAVVDQTVRLRIDTPIEVDYYRHGGILPFVLRAITNKPLVRLIAMERSINLFTRHVMGEFMQ